ncbi:MAG: hypothetical protein JNK93_07515 [Planctomycetia bacterium]|nr:hypothetical protein [Planctomycetia bacterium]
MADEVRMGFEGKFGVALSNPGSPPTDPTEVLEILGDDIQDVQIREDVSGITGIRSSPADRMLEMARSVAGPFTFEPTPVSALAWLPRIFGAAAGSPTGGVTPFTLGNTLPDLDIFSLRKSGNAGLHVFRQCKVASATFMGEEGGRLRCVVNILGRDRDPDITTNYTWPAGLLYDRQVPWRLSDCTLTVAGTPYKFYRFALTVDNLLGTRMMSGSLTPVDFPTSGRRVMLGLSFPWGNGLPLHSTLRTSQLSTGVVKFGYGTGADERYIQFNLPNLIPPLNRSPVLPGRAEIRYDVELMACATTNAGAVVDHSELTASVKAAGS